MPKIIKSVTGAMVRYKNNLRVLESDSSMLEIFANGLYWYYAMQANRDYVLIMSSMRQLYR